VFDSHCYHYEDNELIILFVAAAAAAAVVVDFNNLLSFVPECDTHQHD